MNEGFLNIVHPTQTPTTDKQEQYSSKSVKSYSISLSCSIQAACVVCQSVGKPQRDGYRCTHKTSKHTKPCKFCKGVSCLAIVIGLQEQAQMIEELKITPTAFRLHQSAFHFSERCFIGSVKKHIWPHMWF